VEDVADYVARMEEEKRCGYEILSENLQGRDQVGYLHVDGRIILNYLLEKCSRVWAGL
jgi:hypothetical protein